MNTDIPAKSKSQHFSAEHRAMATLILQKMSQVCKPEAELTFSQAYQMVAREGFETWPEFAAYLKEFMKRYM